MPKMPKKSHPKPIDMAYPQTNFIKAAAENHGEYYYESMYGPAPGSSMGGGPMRKSSNFGHGIGQRAGKLRLSGDPKAHRIGKR